MKYELIDLLYTAQAQGSIGLMRDRCVGHGYLNIWIWPWSLPVYNYCVSILCIWISMVNGCQMDRWQSPALNYKGVVCVGVIVERCFYRS